MGKQTENSTDEDILDPQDMYVTLELEDGSELECRVLTIFETNGRDYIALLSMEDEEEVIFYRYAEDEAGNPSLENIESDEEFDRASDRFDELLDEEAFENQ